MSATLDTTHMIDGFAVLAMYEHRPQGAKRSDEEMTELRACIARAKVAGLSDERTASLFDISIEDVRQVMLS